jgi:alcohol dehydrogenase (cytochrome c)
VHRHAGGEFKGGKGHMFALDAKRGKIVWEFFLAPTPAGNNVQSTALSRTGTKVAYKRSPAARRLSRRFD